MLDPNIHIFLKAKRNIINYMLVKGHKNKREVKKSNKMI